MILAINTCEARGQLALIDKSKVIDCLNWEGRGSHSEVLTEEFSRWVKEAKVDLKNLNSLLCVTGPGSFTGVRVGVSFCRSLAYSLDIPIIDLNSLQLLALNTKDTDLPVLTVLDAQKNCFFMSRFSWNENNLQLVESNSVVPVQELAKIIKEPHQVIGSAYQRYEEYIDDRSNLLTFKGEQQTDLKAINEFPKFINSLTPKNWQEIKPVYIKASAAEEKRKLES